MRRNRRTLLTILIALGLVAMVAAAIAVPRAAAAAWLFALLLALGPATGALTLWMTGKLTGGVWFETLAPVLIATSRLTILVGIAFVPLLFFLPQILPWAAKGTETHDVGLIYLNHWSVIVRLVIAFAGWTLLASIFLPRPGAAGRIAAGLGLVFHIVIVTFLAYDWVLALQPALTSSVFGALVAILFLLSALALAALATPLPSGKPAKDVAGLLIAGVLAVVYLDYMQFLIIWYGDLKDTARFYLDRAYTAPTLALVAALVVGAIIPVAMLLPEEGRNSPEIVRGAALFVLIGLVLHWCWTIFGLFGASAVLVAPAAVAAVAASLVLRFDAMRQPGGAR